MNDVEPAGQVYFEKYLKQDIVRNRINVGNHTFNDGAKVEALMKEDVVQSVADELVEVINNYKVMLYNGQLDIIVAPVVTEAFLAKLNWKGVNSYLNAPKKIWKVNPNDPEIAGKCNWLCAIAGARRLVAIIESGLCLTLSRFPFFKQVTLRAWKNRHNASSTM